MKNHLSIFLFMFSVLANAGLPGWLPSATRCNPHDPKSPNYHASLSIPTFEPLPISTVSVTPSPVNSFTPTPTFSCPTSVSIFAKTAANYGCWDGNNFWISSFYTREFYSISGTTMTTYPSLPFGFNPLVTAWDGRYIWIGTTDLHATIWKFDPTTSTMLGSWQAYPSGEAYGGVQDIQWDGSQLLIAVAISDTDGEVLKWDTSTNSATLTVTNQPNVNGLSWCVLGGQEYILAANSNLKKPSWSKINATTGSYTFYANDLISYRICNDGTYAYTVSFATDTIQKFNLSDGTLIKTWHVDSTNGNGFNAVAFDGKYLWAVNNLGDTYILSTENGVLCKIPNSGVSCVVIGGDFAWTNVYDLNTSSINKIKLP